MRVRDILINDVVLKNTSGRLNKFISKKTKESQKEYMEHRIKVLEKYVKAARSNREKDNNLRELKDTRYKLQQLVKSI